MNRTRGLASAALGGLVAALVLSGCAAPTGSPSPTPSRQTTGTRPADVLAPCNLGEEWDRAALLKVARYDAPAVDDSLLDDYGPTIANNSCSDAAIINWQELRRETGESDEICRITWYDDPFMGLTYPIGCAMPVMWVTDASR